jgi:hypothetical protein
MSRLDDSPPEHDAHLRAALRHMPDAELGAPAALSDTILRAARAATRSAAAPLRARPVRWYDGLAQAWMALARPPVIAGLASVVLLTVVGLSVWEQPVDPRSAPMANTQVAAQPVPAATPTEPATPAATALATPVAMPPAPSPAAVATAAQRRTVAVPGREPLTPERAIDRSGVSAPPPAEARNDLATPFPPALPAPEPTAPHITAEARSLERRALGQTPTGALAEAGPAGGTAAAAKAAPAPALAGASAAPNATDVATGTARAERSSAAARAASPTLTALAEALANEPQRWRVQRGSTPAQSISPALAAWLTQLDAFAAARWQPSDVPRAEVLRSMAAAEIIELRWHRDGVVLHRLWLGADGVLWQPLPGGGGASAYPFWLPVDADTAQRLRVALAAALR